MNSRSLFWASLLFSCLLLLVSTAQTDKGAIAGGNAGAEFKQEVAKAVSKGSTQDSRKDTVSLADIDKWQQDEAADKKSAKPKTTKSTSSKTSSSANAEVAKEEPPEAGSAAGVASNTEVAGGTTAKPAEQTGMPSTGASGENKPVTGSAGVSTMTTLSTTVLPSRAPNVTGGTIP